MKSVGQILTQNRYTSDLNTEEWRSFSSRIRRDRNNTCECCRLGNKITQVHHLFYEWDRKPWDYDPADVVLLCKSCHEQMHEQLKAFRKHVFRNLKPQSFQVLNGALAIALTNYDPLTFCHALAEFVSNPRLVESHAKSWQ